MDTFRSPDEILDYVIEWEEASFACYDDMAASVENDRIRNMFEELAREELGHKERLIEIKKERALFPVRERILDLRIGDYLADVRPGLMLDYPDALLVAIKREKAAFRLYTELAERVEDEHLGAIFRLLAHEEAEHTLRLEMEYDRHIMQEK